MKIPKIKPIDGSAVLQEQARILSAGLPTNADDEMQLNATENFRQAMSALEAENVSPITKPKEILPGTIANPGDIDATLQDTKKDLETLVGINRNLRSGMLAFYNGVVMKENDITGKLKTLRNQLATLKLYARNLDQDNQYIAYSFTDGSQIGAPDSGESLTYSEEEGALLLPCSPEAIVFPEIEAINILPSSVGQRGNSLELSRSRHADINLIADGQTHTWFEFEKVSASRGDSVQLDIQIVFKEPTIINNIRINPANLGTSNWIKIKDIQVDTGEILVSIKDDISTPTWEPGVDPFVLAPAASKFAGQGVYTFSPIRAKSVQISLFQDEPYIVGQKYRYAIGIRELAIAQIPFSTEGSFVLQPARFSRPVRAIGFIHNVAPYDERFIKLEYQVSTDNGITWVPVVPLDNVDIANTEALVLDTPSDSIMVKGKVTRDSAKFGDRAPAKLLKTIEQLVSINTSSTTKVVVDMKPETFLEVIRIGLGCAGLSGSPIFLGTITGSSETSVFEVPIPLPRERLRLLVNGSPWHLASSLPDDPDLEVFLYDDTTTPGQIIFGDGVTGKAPAAGSEVYAYIDTDASAIFSASRPYVAELSNVSDKLTQTTKVVYRDLERKTARAYAGPKQNKIVIPPEHRMIAIGTVWNADGEYEPMDTNDAVRAQGVGAYDTGLQDGRVEFANLEEGERKYVTDWDDNVLYFSPINESTSDVVVEYDYTTAIEIPQKEWQYHPQENKIIINSDKFIPRSHERDTAGFQNERRIPLLSSFNSTATVMRGSIEPIDLTGELGRILDTEVPFNNGAQEFRDIADPNKEGYYSVDYKEGHIYLPEGIGFPEGKIRFLYVAAEIDYGLGIKLQEGIDFIAKGQEVGLTPFYINTHAETTRNRPERNRLLIRYDAFPDADLGGSERERFYSPVIRDIAIVGVSVDPRLGVLESL